MPGNPAALLSASACSSGLSCFTTILSKYDSTSVHSSLFIVRPSCASRVMNQRKNAPRMVGRGASEGEKKAVGLLLSLLRSPSPVRSYRHAEACPTLLRDNRALFDGSDRVLIDNRGGSLGCGGGGGIFGDAPRTLDRGRGDHDLDAAVFGLAFTRGVGGNRPLIAKADVADALRTDVMSHQFLGNADGAVRGQVHVVLMPGGDGGGVAHRCIVRMAGDEQFIILCRV